MSTPVPAPKPVTDWQREQAAADLAAWMKVIGFENVLPGHPLKKAIAALAVSKDPAS
jgi:hypothetical protein